MRILFLFVDGIGLGDDDADANPFVAANLPTMKKLANDNDWIRDTGIQQSERAMFIPTDPRLGVAGRPQSGTSQAVILTGKNIPEIIGRHYGPKPDKTTRNILDEDNMFMRVNAQDKKSVLIDAYPPSLLATYASGKRLPSSIQYAALAAGQDLFTVEDAIAERALTAEWTGHAWRDHLKIDTIPLYTPQEAGKRLVELSQDYTFTFHSHWMTDYVGHRGPFENGVKLLETLDGVLEGILEVWDDDEGLVILTSDHGNMEAMNHKKHTENDVPTLIIGNGKEAFAEGFTTLMDFVPRMERYLFG